MINGMKMLATGGVYADELWIGNLLRLPGTKRKPSPVPCPVVCLVSRCGRANRRPEFAERLRLSAVGEVRESDAMVLCDNVLVPWEKVFVHANTDKSRGIYVETPSHAGKPSVNIRFWAKLQLLTGVLSKITESSGNNQIPAVADQLGRMAALEATLAG